MANCEQIRQWLPLWAGGDLDHFEQLEVQEHLDGCAGCRRAAERWRRDRDRIADLVRDDGGPSVDADWLEGAANRALGTEAGRTRPRSLPWRQFAGPIAAVLVMAIIWLGISPTSPTREDLTSGPEGTATWADLQHVFGGCLQKPVAPGDWTPTRGPGVIAVLAEDPERGTFVVADCIETASLDRVQRFPWLDQRLQHYYRQTADDHRNLVLAVCPTGDQDRATRRALQRNVLERF